MTLEFALHIFGKSTNIKFQANPSSRSRVVPCGQADIWTDMTKLIDAFRNLSKAPKKNVRVCDDPVFIQALFMNT